MPDIRNSIAYVLTASKSMVDWFISDLTGTDWLHRPTPKANCAAWIIGHLILTERGIMRRLGVKKHDLPALPDGFEKRFARDETAPGAAEFGDPLILRPLFNETRQRLIDAAQAVPLEQLESAVDFVHPRFKTVGEMLQFMAVHSSMHAGQISTIRRSLGRPPLI